MTFTVDPISAALLAYVIKKLFQHERLLGVLQNNCPELKGAREE